MSERGETQVNILGLLELPLNLLVLKGYGLYLLLLFVATRKLYGYMISVLLDTNGAQ